MSRHQKKRKTQHKKTQFKSKYKNSRKPVKSKANLSFFNKIKSNKMLTSLKEGVQNINFKGLKNKFSNINFSKVWPFKKSDHRVSFSENVDLLKKYIGKYKKEFIFFTGMTVIAAGLFVFISQPDTKNQATVQQEMLSVDLSQANDSMLMNVDAEIAQIMRKESETNDQGLVLDLTSSEAALPVLDETLSEDLVEEIAPPVDIITPNSVDGIYGTNVSNVEVKTDEVEAFKPVSSAMLLGVTSYAILVDEEPVAFFEKEEEANNFLEALKEEFRDPEAVEERVIFKETIRVEKYKNDILEFQGYQDFDTVMEYIKKGTNEQKIHTVQEGENFWVIAERNDMNPYDLIDANPGINENRLQIGTELSLIVAEPIINVLSISTVERTDEIPYGRGESVKTDKYFVGRSVVKVSGVPGEAKNLIEVYTENGKILGERILSSEIIREPVDMVSYVGTKPAPPAIGTGTFSNPTSRGYITSSFGNRSLGWHKGIDIGVSMRTSVLAADGGVVVFAGYQGTYGKLVIIDHGANKTTYYAHNDSFLVSAGEKVFKGQPISLSGNTGRSTGPHLHFEIRINNEPVNPKKYVNY